MKLPTQNRKKILQSILFIVVHLFILNVLFVYRYSPLEVEPKFQQWKKGELGQNPLNYIKFYFSPIHDESYYYEWGTLVLGKTFEDDYLLPKDRFMNLRPFFEEAPKIRIPYRDIPFEYPPLMIAPILTARLLCNNYLDFTRVLAGVISLIYFASLGISYKIWKQISERQKYSFIKILFFSSLSLICLGALFVTRLDVFPSLICLLALYTFIKEKYILAVLLVTIGFFTKAYPILLAPLFAIVLIRQKKTKTALLCGFSLLLLILSITVGMEWITSGHYSEALKFHSQRGIQIESIYSFIPILTHLYFQTPVFVSEGHGSLNFHTPTLTHLVQLSSILPILGFGLIYFIFWKKLKRVDTNLDSQKNESIQLLIQASLLLIFVFILTFKVLSPQFLIWLIPIIFLVRPTQKSFFPLFFIALFLSQMIYPNFYTLLTEGNPFVISMLILRNSFLLILFGSLLKNFIYPTKHLLSDENRAK